MTAELMNLKFNNRLNQLKKVLSQLIFKDSPQESIHLNKTTRASFFDTRL